MGNGKVIIIGPHKIPTMVPVQHLSDGTQMIFGVSAVLAGLRDTLTPVGHTNVMVVNLVHPDGSVMVGLDMGQSGQYVPFGVGLDACWEAAKADTIPLQAVIIGMIVSSGTVGHFATPLGMCGEVAYAPDGTLGWERQNFGDGPLTEATIYVARKAWGQTWEPLPQWA